MKIRFWCENSMSGGYREDFEEFDDDATDEEIEEAAREWFFNLNSYGWHKVEEDKKA